MQTTQKSNVTLPNDMAEIVEPALASGEYALANEVIRDGRAASVDDADLENWLVHQVEGQRMTPSKPTRPAL